MYYVYVLYSKKFGRMYVGMTVDPTVRLKEHNSGKTRSTKAFVPWELIHSEVYLTRDDAREREKYLKSAAGRRWRNKNIEWPRGATEYPPEPNGHSSRSGGAHGISALRVGGLNPSAVKNNIDEHVLCLCSL